MVQLTLDDEKAQTLQLALENYLSELRMEIVDTDSKQFREALKHRKSVLQEIVDELARVMAPKA